MDSNRQALFWGVLTVICINWSGGLRAQDTNFTTENLEPMTCSYYSKATTTAKDGTPPKFKAGDTRAKTPYATDFQVLQRRLVPPKYTCSCNHSEWNDESECLNNCQATLGCFTGICPMLSGPEVCVKAADMGKFLLTETTTFRPWVMPTQDSAVEECTSAAQKYASLVQNHEAGHRQVNKSVVDDWNQTISTGFGPVEHCASTEQEAETMDEADLFALIKQSEKGLAAKLKEANDDYDDDPKNQHPPLQCKDCPD